MIHLDEYLKENQSVFAKYAAPMYGVRIPFTEKKISWLMLVQFGLFIGVIIGALLFPNFYDATTDLYDNWVTGKPASNALTIGLMLTVVWIIGGAATGHYHNNTYKLGRKWLRENNGNRGEWTRDDYLILTALGIAH